MAMPENGSAEIARLEKEYDRLQDMGGHDTALREITKRLQRLNKLQGKYQGMRRAAGTVDAKAIGEATALAKQVLEAGRAKDFIKATRPPVSPDDYFNVEVFPDWRGWGEKEGQRFRSEIPIDHWVDNMFVAGGQSLPGVKLQTECASDLSRAQLAWVIYCIEYCVNQEGYVGERHDPHRLVGEQGQLTGVVPAFAWNYAKGKWAFEARREQVKEFFQRRAPGK